MKDVHQKIYRVRCDPEKIASGFPGLTAQDIVDILQDGRPASSFSERIAAVIFSVQKAKNNSRGFDLTAGNQDTRAEVKGLTKKVSFHESGNTGKNRTCTADDVLRLIKRVDTFVVVDVLKFPDLLFIKIPGSVVMEWYYQKRMNQRTGDMTRLRFEKAVQELNMEEEEWSPLGK